MPTQLKTEDAIILHHTRRCLQETEWTIRRLSTEKIIPALADLGVEECPDHREAEDFLAWKQRIGVQFGRVMNGSTKFPLSWKWAWINSLPDPYRSDCLNDLFSLAGAFYVPYPKILISRNKEATISHFQELVECFSKIIACSQPAHDGVYDASDDKETAHMMMDAISEMNALLHKEAEAIGRGTGCFGRLREISLTVRYED